MSHYRTSTKQEWLKNKLGR